MLKKRYAITLLISIAGLVGALPFFLQKKDSAPITLPLGSKAPAQQAIQEALAEQHKEIIEAVRADFDIPADAWNKAMDEFKALRAADTLLLDTPAKSYKKSKDPLVNHIKELLAQECINPDKVAIAYVSNPGCPLLAVQEFAENNQITHRIHIDKAWFQKQDEKVRDAILAHEMVHLKQHDSIEGGYMIDTVLEQGHTREEYEKSKAVRNYRHFREIRADLLAGAKDIAVAQTLQKVFSGYMANAFEDNHHHPTSALRHEQMTTLISYLNAEQQTVSA